MSARSFPPVDLPVFIPSWEIECCAPPPVVGESTRWSLIFETVATPDRQSLDRVPGSVTELQWQVESWSPDDDIRALYRNGFAAYYRPTDDVSVDPLTALPLGRHLVRGTVSGTKHGGFVNDSFPTVSATVNRIQVVSGEFRLHDREATPISGSTGLKDVQQSPKWFTHHPPRLVADSAAASTGRRAGRPLRKQTPTVQVYRAETGVLLQLHDVKTYT